MEPFISSLKKNSALRKVIEPFLFALFRPKKKKASNMENKNKEFLSRVMEKRNCTYYFLSASCAFVGPFEGDGLFCGI